MIHLTLSELQYQLLHLAITLAKNHCDVNMPVGCIKPDDSYMCSTVNFDMLAKQLEQCKKTA